MIFRKDIRKKKRDLKMQNKILKVVEFTKRDFYVKVGRIQTPLEIFEQQFGYYKMREKDTPEDRPHTNIYQSELSTIADTNDNF